MLRPALFRKPHRRVDCHLAFPTPHHLRELSPNLDNISRGMKKKRCYQGKNPGVEAILLHKVKSTLPLMVESGMLWKSSPSVLVDRNKLKLNPSKVELFVHEQS